MEELRAVVGEGPTDAVLQGLLDRTGGDVSAAANGFFDGSFANSPPLGASTGTGTSASTAPYIPDDVMTELFKTLEDVGRKLAERDQQLDVTTKACEILQRRLQELEQYRAKIDADESDRQMAEEEARQVEAERLAAISPDEESVEMERPEATGSTTLAHMPLHIFRNVLPRLLHPMHVLRWIGRFIGVPLLLPQRPSKRAREEEEEPNGGEQEGNEDEGEDDSDEEGNDVALEFEGDEERGEEGEEGEGEDDEEDDEEGEGEDDSMGLGATATQHRQVTQVASAVAAAQAAAQATLPLPAELLVQVAEWEQQQSAAEMDWRQRQTRMTAEFEERKRRLQEHQLGQRKKFRENCDDALRPLYMQGSMLSSQLEQFLRGKLCRLCEFIPAGMSNGAASTLQRQPGPLARIAGVSFGRIDSPLRAPHCPSRSVGGVPVSSGLLVTLEKLVDRNGIAMLPASEDPMLAFRSRGYSDIKLPLRLLGSRVRILTDAEAADAQPELSAERVFVVRYAGGENGSPIEPVQILPDGLSLADYDISFAAGVSALRVEHRTDGPVKCRAEPVARKQVFSETPVELYTQEVDEETHNIVQLYFSDLRDEVAVDVLNVTGTGLTLEDTECIAFPDDATGAQLNYKIIVREARVIAVLYQEGGQVRQSQFVEHRLPTPGTFVTLADGATGVLQALPRGLIVSRTPRDLPENAAVWPPRPGMRAKGKHPAELPGFVDVKVVEQHGTVVWPVAQCSVPVCALEAADSSRLQTWHTLWDSWLQERKSSAIALAEKIETALESNKQGSATTTVSELSSLYGQLEERQRELQELEVDDLDSQRLAALQRGIQRFAALARYG